MTPTFNAEVPALEGESNNCPNGSKDYILGSTNRVAIICPH